MQKKAKKGGNQQNTLENGNQGARANKSQVITPHAITAIILKALNKTTVQVVVNLFY